MSNHTIQTNNTLFQHTNRRVWIVPESQIKTDDETSQEQWGYDDWEIYHG